MKNYSNRGDFLMKAQKKSDTNMSLREKKEITQKNIGAELSGHKNAVPNKIFYLLTFVSLGLPNLVFSGLGWFDTLHIMKWSSAMVPIALISMIGGLSLALYGNELTDFKIDHFGWLWLIMLGYASIQPMWVNIMSWSTYMKEWFFFASLISLYIFSFNLFKGSKAHKTLLWLANINAGINVIFAELLIREMNGLFPFIMNVPGNYIGNTGQQEMFGLWMAMAVMNGIYLNAAYSCSPGETGTNTGTSKIPKHLNRLLLALNAWGMWNSTTRAGFLSLITGTIIISIIFMRNDRKEMLKKIGQGVLIVLLMLAFNIGMTRLGFGRAYALLNKTMDMLVNTSSFGKRRDIWKTSWAIFMEHPVKGVGLGHYKWHYLEGQTIAIKKDPKMRWQFTYWAHNEYLQWFAEFGIFGALMLISTGAWWLWKFIRHMTQKKMLSIEASWACAMLFLILFDAIFSRPFHRIENVVWLSLAFAIVNRELLPLSYSWSEVKHTTVYRIIGGFILFTSVYAIIFLGFGLVGDKYLRNAINTEDAEIQAAYINKAKKIPMTRDQAEEQYAYHLIAVAKQTGAPQDWADAINQLYLSFTIRPQAKQLRELLSLAGQTHNMELISALVPYLPPNRGGKLPESNSLSSEPE